MKKAELLRHLREGKLGEESAIALYLQHLTAVVSRVELPPQDKERVRLIMKTLLQANRKHFGLMKELIAQVTEDSRDDF